MAGIIIPIVCYAIIFYVVGTISWSLWKQRKKGPPAWPPYPLINATEEEMDRRRAEVRDMLSHKALGAERARRLWGKLQRAEIGGGLIHEFHRDFCGHGLIRTQAGIILCDIQDGHFPGPAIATWDNEREFVDFFARQSDFTMSGWEPAEPVFFTEDKWYRNNQRLRAEIIDRFL
ncbi:hypothetical protein J2046_002112 [Rhizobium petrolearium]|uniref:hypothetical protein n=1 Tax=Neorhizobium petrolearium TaxID=515361 RepID=UPI001AEADEF7|nr:hypothetical protein [Neorhizobium petrolearium]MBP1843856.1 hypothetical protein [Neorhizobium petrolearium]